VDKNILGLEMSEWRRLAGLETMPSLVESSSSPVFDDVDEGDDFGEEIEFTTEDIDGLWFEFLHENGIDPDDFVSLMDEAIASGNQDDIDAILQVEELFEANVSLRLQGLRGQISPEQIGVKRRESPVNPSMLRKAGVSKIRVQDKTPEAEKVKKAMGIVRQLKTDEFEFECDADDNGDPGVNWDDVISKYGEWSKSGSKS
jgi:hypothetical protein